MIYYMYKDVSIILSFLHMPNVFSHNIHVQIHQLDMGVGEACGEEALKYQQ